MDIAVYLPDGIGAWAKKHEIPFSQLLRAAVIEARTQMEALEALAAESSIHELEAVDEEGHRYRVRLHGTLIAQSEKPLVSAYLTDDEQLVVYAPDDRIHYLDQTEDLAGWFSGADLIRAMSALGEEAVIDIGEAS
jgi:hypothetical protein